MAVDINNMNFKTLCNFFRHSACVVSVQKVGDSYGEIRIVDGNDLYTSSFKSEDYYKSHEFVPNSLYTDYLAKNLNFEEYSFRAAVKKELLHSYAYPEFFRAWMHMLFIPIDYQQDDLFYCLYVMEINPIFDPELLANPNEDINSRVINATLQLTNTTDFKASLKNVTREIRKICNAMFCCILLVNEETGDLNVLAEDKELGSDRKTMYDYVDEQFYRVVKTWDNMVASNGNCLIVSDQKGMDYIKDNNPIWYQSLHRHGVNSVVLFKLKSGQTPLGYMWVSNFKADDTPKIKEALEITTFILGTEIGNHLLLDRLERLSSTDLLTGLYNRNKLNAFMNEIAESEDAPTALLFLDINGLKRVNDKEGHISGDHLIKRAANTLISVFTENDIFRVGGDEFVVVLRNYDEKQVHEFIDKLQRKAKKNDVSFALGYAMTNTSKDIEELLKEADARMYEDKRKFYRK